MLPSLISQLVVLLKDTSLGFIIGYLELLRVNRELRDFFGSRYIFSLFIVTAVALPRGELHPVPGRGLPRTTRHDQGGRRGGIDGSRG